MTRLPLYSYLLLIDPARVLANLDRVAAAGVIERRPNLWQLCLGSLRMWHRLIFRPDTIGNSTVRPPRRTLRARLLAHRAIRLPALLVERAVAPWDFTGLFSSPDRTIRHLLGASHDRDEFIFDFQILAGHPGRLDEVVDKARRVVENDTARSRWLRDLVVFDGYHEALLEAAESATRSELELTAAEAADPDHSLTGLLHWCADAPETPHATWLAWRAGTFRLGPRTSEPRSEEQAVA